MVQRVYEQVLKSSAVSDVLVATDDKRIYEAVQGFGGNAVYTDAAHPSGTDRCFEAYQKSGLNCDVILNVQGDEPFIEPGQITQVAELFKKSEVNIGTLVKKINDPVELRDPNKVKAVIDVHGKALYFSRQPVPYLRNDQGDNGTEKHTYFKHIGLYGFRSEILSEIVKLPVSDLERAESLEQLRWLENGFSIHTTVTAEEAISVDTPEDLEKLLALRKPQF